MKKIISLFLAVFMTLAVSVTAFAAEDGGKKTVTEVPDSVDIPVSLCADLTPGYKAPVEDGKAKVTGQGFTAEGENAPKDAIRLVVIPIDDKEAVEWFSGCAGSRWSSTGTFYAVFYEDAKGNRFKADGVKLTVQFPGVFDVLQVFSLDPDEDGQFVERFDTSGSSVAFTTNGRLYYGVMHRQGAVDEQTTVGEGAPNASVDMTPEELADAVLSDEDREYLDEGIDVHIKLTIDDITDTVSSADKQAVLNAANGFSVGEYVDIELLKQIGDRPWVNLHETKKPIRITLEIPNRLLGPEGREFAIVRVHNGNAEFLTDLDSNPATITFETNEFSTYAILYRDPGSPSNPNESGSPQTGDESRLILWLALAAVSLAGMITAILLRKKKGDKHLREGDE